MIRKHLLTVLFVAVGVILLAGLAVQLPDSQARAQEEQPGAVLAPAVDVMRQFECVPIGEEEGAFLLALADPTDLPRLDQLERALGRSCRIHVAPRSAIAESLRESTRNSQVVAKIKDEFRPLLVRENDEGEEVLSVEKVQRDLSPIVQLVDTIILNALQNFLADFDSVGKQLDQARTAFNAARGKLTESNQALIPRARRLHQLGAKGKKALSAELIGDAEPLASLASETPAARVDEPDDDA